jgi:hypothetical protein
MVYISGHHNEQAHARAVCCLPRADAGQQRTLRYRWICSCALASVAPTVMEAMDEEAEEVAAELDATEEPSGGDASAEEAATQAAPEHAIRNSYCGVEFYLQLNDFYCETIIFHL